MRTTYRIRINPQRQFQVVQAVQWAAYGDAWLCAHDLFHHHPDDDGSMHCEAMSFGAELWIAYPGAGTDAISPLSFAGVTSAVYEHRPDLRGLILRRGAPPMEALEEHLQQRLGEVVDDGLAAAARHIEGHREAAGLRPRRAAAMQALTSPLNRGRYAQWMAFGYRRAERRFPSARKTQRLIESFQAFLGTAAEGSGACITVEIDEAALCFRQLA